MTTILVVEDDIAIIDFLRTFLEEEGYKIMVAHNGEEGLACLASARPALVLSDLMMPVLNGQELYKRMQADPRYRSIPFVLMSAVRTALNQKDSHYAAVVAKPFELNDLIDTVERLIPNK
jgi:CheY-like chemotaxis protein